VTTHILAIDQGTTSTRAVVFGAHGREVATAQAEFAQHYPADGWVEHDALEIWRATQSLSARALAQANLNPAQVASIGITNQRETVVVWDRATGQPIHNAIVWQDRRTAETCAQLKTAGHEAAVQAKTGLLLDPYFSATKIAWILDHLPGARARAAAGELAAGTVDSWLIWQLTGGRTHATDATNASRTLLYDIHAGRWCPELAALFGVPLALLPEVRDCAANYGTADALGAPIPIRGVAGDQQAAMIGQNCFRPGELKCTFGTGAFLLINTGTAPVHSAHRLLTTIGYRLDGATSYALEGSAFVAGAAVKWLRDALGLIGSAGETEALAASVPDAGGVHLVPAFVGLGAPHWRPDARAALTGLTLGTTRAHLARAALEGVAFETADLTHAMAADGARCGTVRVDGGMAANRWLCQFLADVLGCEVERPAQLESTALGAAYLAGIGCGLWPGLDAVAALPRQVERFRPAIGDAERAALLAGWREALARVLLQP
jgi:glycerol kinase